MTQRTVVNTMRLVFGLLVLLAIGRQLSIHVGLNYNVLNFFSYFTNLSNLLAALVLLLGAYNHFSGGEPSAAYNLLRFMSAISMVIVGIVFSLLLRNVDLGSLLPWINTLLHYLMPVLVFLDWIIDPPRTRIRPSQLVAVLAFPALYLVYTLVRGSATQWYPYPFFNPATAGGYGAVAMYSAAITITFLITGWLLMMVANKRTDTSTS